METNVEYYDLANQTIYGMIFSSGNLGLTNNGNDFQTYTDAAATGFAHTFGADANRSNRYAFDLSPFMSVLTEGVYELAIYSQNGASVDVDNDNIKLVEALYWSSGLVDEVTNPDLVSTDFAGDIEYNNSFAWLANVENQFGSVTTVDNNLDFIIKEDGSSTVATGHMTYLESGIYYGNQAVSAPTFDTNKSYQIIMNAHIDNIPVKSVTSFTVASGSVCATGTVDILNDLGYISGTMTTSINTSGFNTSLTETTNDLFNGSILRLTDGNFKGHARIISDYSGLTKRISLNKPMAVTPVSGTTFVIFPIGGELNN